MKINSLELPQQLDNAAQPATSSGFADTLAGAIQKVDALQTQGDLEAEKTARGEGNLHELSIALEKADTAMRVAVKARNKIVDAYSEVMRMSV